MGSPVHANEKGVWFDPDTMEQERLYHCIYRGKAILVFKDSQDVTNCYEVEDADLVTQIEGCSDDVDLEGLLEKYIGQMRLNG